MTFGQKLRRLRLERDWTQVQLAEFAEINIPSVNRYEMDRVQPRYKMLQKFAEIFKTDVRELLPDDPSEKSSCSFQDRELYQQMLAADALSEEARITIKRVLKAFIVENQIHNLTKSA